MGRAESPRTIAAVDAVRVALASGGTLRGVSDAQGIQLAQLQRACKRAGIVFARGRPARNQTP
jgi:hypothetical protein